MHAGGACWVDLEVMIAEPMGSMSWQKHKTTPRRAVVMELCAKYFVEALNTVRALVSEAGMRTSEARREERVQGNHEKCEGGGMGGWGGGRGTWRPATAPAVGVNVDLKCSSEMRHTQENMCLQL
jgi:hypothetical protein